MGNMLIINDLEFFENSYISTIDDPRAADKLYTHKNREFLRNISTEDTPKKFLNEDLANEIAKELRKHGVITRKIWLLPYDFDELDESRNTIIVITISPEDADSNNYDAIRIHHIIKDLLWNRPVGAVWPFVVWDFMLEDCIPNPILPKYKATWSNPIAKHKQHS